MKKIWLTSLINDEPQIKKLFTHLKQYGLPSDGHFWKNDPEKMAWTAVTEPLLDPSTALWAIVTDKDSLTNPETRYGLSLVAMTLSARRGLGFPIVILSTTADLPDPDQLPTPLKGADILPAATSGAKLTAKVHARKSPAPPEYFLDIIASPEIGQWFTVGPTETTWPGAIFGVSGGNIAFHAVGPRGGLPEKSVLNYPMQGLKLILGETEYTAWAVQNEIGPDAAYLVKVEKEPDTILFGPYSTEDETDVFTLTLK